MADERHVTVGGGVKHSFNEAFRRFVVVADRIRGDRPRHGQSTHSPGGGVLAGFLGGGQGVVMTRFGNAGTIINTAEGIYHA